MARVNLYVPDEVAEQIRRLPADVSLSALFRAAVAELTSCRHEGPVRCLRCGTVHVPRTVHGT